MGILIGKNIKRAGKLIQFLAFVMKLTETFGNP